MAYYEQGTGPAVIFLHGFPELAYSWRHQLPAFAAAGYRAIAPDQRGCGQTSVPKDVSAYAIEELIADIEGLLDALQLDSAIFVAHDWGALVLWHMAMRLPERIERLIALNIPHYPRLPVDPMQVFRERFGDDFYIVNFQDSDEADRRFAKQSRQFFERLMRKNQIRRADYDKLPDEMKTISLLRLLDRDEVSGEPVLNDEELDYYVAAFKKTGFTGPINWYRNWTRNWEGTRDDNFRIDIPTLFIGAADDIVVAPAHIDGMRSLVTNLDIKMLDPCGHWSQQEQPNAVNRLILDWLARHKTR